MRRGPVVAIALAAVAAAVVGLGVRKRPPPPSPIEEAGAPNVTVAVYDDGAPLTKRPVVFHDASGAVIGTATTDESGRARGAVPSGGMVTVAIGTSVGELVTMLGVEPGDALVFGEAEDEGSAGRSVATVTPRTTGRFAGARRYVADIGVGTIEIGVADAGAVSLPVLRRFVDGDAGLGRFRVLAEAFGDGGSPLAFAFGWGDTGPTPDATVDVVLPPWSAGYAAFTVEIDGPSDRADIVGRAAIVAGSGVRFERPAVTAILAPNVPRTKLRFPIPARFPGDLAVSIGLTWPDSADHASFTKRVGPAGEGALGLDRAKDMLPRVSAATVDTTEASRPRIGWTAGGGGASADVVVLQITWAERAHVWRVIAPPATKPGVRLPALPDALARLRPTAGAKIATAVGLLESSEFEGYGDVRKKGLEVATEPIEEDADAVVRFSTTGDLTF